ncbi:hypothetical protein HELRODRAFT_158601 [Helobdella robusta]|uniref:Uncharacterized protein n=1 Tax=Helobdella robusta TaxID=6412 RepID=T1EN03_HELRO|nr:hypothetical protein HELRODRAFT_158601 [Helobdella robusta]ESO12150.1 hypothetical protein HELRODRAFT_158601 [Helobdella robusta]
MRRNYDLKHLEVARQDRQRKLLIDTNQDIEMGDELFFPILWFSEVVESSTPVDGSLLVCLSRLDFAESVVEGDVGAVVVGIGDGMGGLGATGPDRRRKCYSMQSSSKLNELLNK